MMTVDLSCLPLDMHGDPLAVGLTGITTCTPAVPEVFGSGRNVGALCSARRVGFRSLASGLADDLSQGHIICVMRAAPLISNGAPNSKQVKCTLDHCA